MKKLIIIIVIALFFVSCEKEKKFLEVEIVAIENLDTICFVYYNVANSSDMNIDASINFKIDGFISNNYKTDCKTYYARAIKTDVLVLKKEVEFVDCKIKLCE